MSKDNKRIKQLNQLEHDIVDFIVENVSHFSPVKLTRMKSAIDIELHERKHREKED